MRYLFLATALLCSQAFANSQNTLNCTEYNVRKPRVVTIRYTDERGVAQIKSERTGSELARLGVLIDYINDGFTPSLRIYNWDWSPRFGLDLNLVGDTWIGIANLVTSDHDIRFTVRCKDE